MSSRIGCISLPACVRGLAAICIALALSRAAEAQTLDGARLDQFFDRLAEKNQAMGSLTIAKDGQVLYARSIGYSQVSPAARTALTASSRFRIGSITKMFTATMVLQLVEEGELRLTDHIDRFFPEIPNASRIQVAQILAHIVRSAPEFEPDTKYSYSNMGYWVLGLILERLTGASYATALESRVASRIGLRDTYVATGPIDVTKNESVTYFNAGADWRQGPQTDPSYLFSAGAIVSTPDDLARFIQALFDGELVSRASVDLMTMMRDAEGLGIGTFTFSGRTFYGYTGGGDNYGAWLAYQPEERLVIAYTTNAKVYPVKDIVTGVAAIYYHEPFEIPAFETMVVSPEILDQYVGVYSSPDLAVTFTITRDGSKLLVQPGNQSATALEATAINRFQLLGGSVVFEFDAAKKQLIQVRGGVPRTFTKHR